jgi:hypothetical protein
MLLTWDTIQKDKEKLKISKPIEINQRIGNNSILRQ